MGVSERDYMRRPDGDVPPYVCVPPSATAVRRRCRPGDWDGAYVTWGFGIACTIVSVVWYLAGETFYLPSPATLDEAQARVRLIGALLELKDLISTHLSVDAETCVTHFLEQTLLRSPGSTSIACTFVPVGPS